jgi:hypothetical protein
MLLQIFEFLLNFQLQNKIRLEACFIEDMYHFVINRYEFKIQF